MSTRKILPTVIAALVAATVAAVAANTTFFTSIGDLVFPLAPPNSSGDNGSIGDTTRGGMAPVNGSGSYTKVGSVLTTGFSYYFGNFQREMLFEPSGTISVGNIGMAPSPVDGASACIFSTQAVSTLTINANIGQSINNAVTALTANVRYCYTYSKSNTTWDRSN